jgi:hypothetical protein
MTSGYNVCFATAECLHRYRQQAAGGCGPTPAPQIIIALCNLADPNPHHPIVARKKQSQDLLTHSELIAVFGSESFAGCTVRTVYYIVTARSDFNGISNTLKPGIKLTFFYFTLDPALHCDHLRIYHPPEKTGLFQSIKPCRRNQRDGFFPE